jgi:hypothetical protein
MGAYWPQSQAVVIGQSWKGRVRVGNDAWTTDKRQDILLVRVDDNADEAFADWHARADEVGDYVPMHGLPPGATTLAGVRITRAP